MTSNPKPIIRCKDDLKGITGFTWQDLVRQVFPKADDKTADYLLWEFTGFPQFWVGDHVVGCLTQLEEVKTKSGNWDGDPNAMPSFQWFYDEINESLKKMEEEEAAREAKEQPKKD